MQDRVAQKHRVGTPLEGFEKHEMLMADVFTVGDDMEGNRHVYHRGADEVVVYNGRHVDHREQLDGRLVDEWIGFVETKRGWMKMGELSAVGLRVDRARKTDTTLVEAV